MRSFTFLAALFLMVLTTGAPVSAQDDTDATYRGFVTGVSRSAKVVTVEKMISGNPGPVKGEFAVDGDTEIFRQQDGEPVRASFEDLTIAQLVEVSYSGSGGSEPLETVAGEIVILSGPSGGPSNSQNQYSLPPADPDLQGQYEDSSGGGSSEPTVDDLPDTGGAPLAVVAAVAVVVSGGLLLRRASG